MNPTELIEISVGIPAYNEEANIRNLLNSVLSQKEEGFTLKEILVISDQSTDNTVAESLKVADKRIRVESAPERGGKAARFRDLAKSFKGDVLVQFDADVKLSNNKVLAELVKVLKKEKADLICCRIEPIPARTFIEKVAVFGSNAWESYLKSAGDKELIHRCHGRGRLFSRKFLSNFYLPDNASACEDAFSFYFAIKNGFKVAFATNAIINYRLPSTKKDFVKQTKRNLNSRSVLVESFGTEIVDVYHGKTDRGLKLKALLLTALVSSPVISITYILSQIYIHFFASTAESLSIWNDATSTKQLT